jgi:hypothetical protein
MELKNVKRGRIKEYADKYKPAVSRLQRLDVSGTRD